MPVNDYFLHKNMKVSLHTNRHHRHFRNHPRFMITGGPRTKLQCSKIVTVNFNVNKHISF